MKPLDAQYALVDLHELSEPVEHLLCAPTFAACRLPREPRLDPRYRAREAVGQQVLPDDELPDDGPQLRMEW